MDVRSVELDQCWQPLTWLSTVTPLNWSVSPLNFFFPLNAMNTLSHESLNEVLLIQLGQAHKSSQNVFVGRLVCRITLLSLHTILTWFLSYFCCRWNYKTWMCKLTKSTSTLTPKQYVFIEISYVSFMSK